MADKSDDKHNKCHKRNQSLLIEKPYDLCVFKNKQKLNFLYRTEDEEYFDTFCINVMILK